jgi:hypothetical protein
MSQDGGTGLPAVRHAFGVVFAYGGVEVAHDGEGRICLNHMWQAAGTPKSKEPWRWAETEQAKRFIENLAQSSNLAKNEVWKSKRGKHLGGTWADWRIAVAYAEYLSPAFHLYVVEVFHRWHQEEFNPDLKVRRAVERYRKRGWDDQRILARIEGIIRRRGFTDGLKEHGVDEEGYPSITNAVYVALYGKTAKGLKQGLGLPDKARLRDHLGADDLATLSWVESISITRIKACGAKGNAECREECRRVAERARETLRSLGIDPENDQQG